MPETPSLAQLRERLDQVEGVVLFTGAGMSADSGIPTYRGAGGLWRGVRAESLAHPLAFRADPQLVTDWYRERRRQMAAAPIHAGHRAAAAFCRRRPNRVVVTQNVDGFHQRTGCPEVLELHGSVWVERCTHCGEETPLDREGPLAEEGEEVPLCSCGGHLRPGVVWFSEGLPAETLGAAGRLIRRAGALIVVGTSGVVEPAASLVRLAPPGMLLVEVNPAPAIEGAIQLPGTAADLLPRLLGAE